MVKYKGKKNSQKRISERTKEEIKERRKKDKNRIKAVVIPCCFLQILLPFSPQNLSVTSTPPHNYTLKQFGEMGTRKETNEKQTNKNSKRKKKE